MKPLKLVSLLFLLTACGADSEMNDKLSAVDDVFASFNSSETPGVAVMIIKDGEIILKKGYGIADFDSQTSVSANSNFRLASVSKQFTALSILQLVERGELTLNTTLKDIFPDYPTYGASITIEHLLQHTSGILDYEPMIPEAQKRQVKDKDVLDYMYTVDDTYFPVGDGFKYSNTAFALLTQIIEKITGNPYREYLNKNIFGPLNMTNTLAFENGINEVPNRAYGYTVEGAEIRLTDQSVTSAVLGDGGIYSNLNDLFKWDQSLYTNSLLGRELLDLAFANHTLNNGEPINYGFGWWVEAYEGFNVNYHTGLSIGFRNIIYRVPSEKFTVVILTNNDAGEERISLDRAHMIMDIFY